MRAGLTVLHQLGIPEDEPADARIERLLREIEQRNDLFSVVSHELRNPLHALSLSLSLARMTAELHQQPDTLARVDKSQALLKRYVGRVTLLLDLMRLGGETPPIQLREVDLSTLLSELGEAMSQEAHYRGVALTVLAPPSCVVSTDPQLLEQIVDNLLINALKHAACTQVTVSLLPEAPGRFRIEVADNGRGIDEADQARIFGKFGVAQNSERGTGTGLGLWIVRRLATALGGTVTLQSRPRGGCLFILNFPFSAREDS